MYSSTPRRYRPKLLSSRVDTLRWLSFIQLALGLILFILGVAMVGVDMEDWVDRPSSPDFHNRVDNQFRILMPQPLTSINVMFLAMPTIVLAVGAGVTGSILSRYKGLAYNVPARHLLIVVSAMNFMTSMGFMIFQGQVTFEFIDAELLDSDDSWEVGVLAIQLVMFIFVFFVALFAGMTTTLATLWNPPMEPEPVMQNYPGSLERERPPRMEKMRPNVPESYYPRDFSEYAPFYGYGNGGGGWGAPALKYY